MIGGAIGGRQGKEWCREREEATRMSVLRAVTPWCDKAVKEGVWEIVAAMGMKGSRAVRNARLYTLDACSERRGKARLDY